MNMRALRLRSTILFKNILVTFDKGDAIFSCGNQYA